MPTNPIARAEVAMSWLLPGPDGPVEVRTYRIPPRARALLRAAVLTADDPGPLLRDHHGRLFLARRMANLVRRGADHAAVLEPPAARPSSTWDRAEPYASAFTATASITRTSIHDHTTANDH